MSRQQLAQLRRESMLQHIGLQEKSRRFKQVDFNSHHKGLIYLSSATSADELKKAPVLMTFYDTANTSVKKLTDEVQKLTMRTQKDPLNSKVHALFYRHNNKEFSPLFFRPAPASLHEDASLGYDQEIIDRSIEARIEERFAATLANPVGYFSETANGPRIEKYHLQPLVHGKVLDKCYVESPSEKFFLASKRA